MMPSNFVSEDIEAVVAALLGAIDVDAGATDEQLAVLQAFATHLYRPKSTPASFLPCGRLADTSTRCPTANGVRSDLPTCSSSLLGT
mgnify:CR=1 FL=1